MFFTVLSDAVTVVVIFAVAFNGGAFSVSTLVAVGTVDAFNVAIRLTGAHLQNVILNQTIMIFRQTVVVILTDGVG